MFFSHHEATEDGFTLTELLVVILIIGILAAIAIPLFLNQRKAAREAGVKSDLKNAADLVEGSYNAETQKYRVPSFLTKGNGDTNGGSESMTDTAFGPVHLSPGNLASYQAMGENFCLSAFHQDDVDNVWYLNSIDGKLSKNAQSCLGGTDGVDNEDNTSDTGSGFKCSPEVKAVVDNDVRATQAFSPAYFQLLGQVRLGLITQAQFNANPVVTNYNNLYAQYEASEDVVYNTYTTAANGWRHEYTSRMQHADEQQLEQRRIQASSDYFTIADTRWSDKLNSDGTWIRDITEIQSVFDNYIDVMIERAEVMCGDTAVEANRDVLRNHQDATLLAGVPACHALVAEYTRLNLANVRTQNAEYIMADYMRYDGLLTDDTRWRELDAVYQSTANASNSAFTTMRKDTTARANNGALDTALMDAGYNFSGQSTAMWRTYSAYIQGLIDAGETTPDQKADALFQDWLKVEEGKARAKCGI